MQGILTRQINFLALVETADGGRLHFALKAVWDDIEVTFHIFRIIATDEVLSDIWPWVENLSQYVARCLHRAGRVDRW